MVRARLERDDGGGAARRFAVRGRVTQRHHLGVGAARVLGVAASDHAAVGRGEHAADARIGFAQSDGLAGKVECLAHQGFDRHRGAAVRVDAAL